MKLHESGENYLETILILEQRNGRVRSIDIANEMGFSKPSISRAVHLLEKDGYLAIVAGGYIELTEMGRNKAEEVYERHIFLTEFLISMGVSETQAAEDACRMEHIISNETLAALKAHQVCREKDCPRVSQKQLFDSNRKVLSGKEA